MDGVLVIDKPSGVTSHDVVVRARRAVGTRRVGHIGTLDPMATGVLPLVVGRATRLASLLSVGPKVYDATIKLGVVTDSYDVTGAVISASPDQQARAEAVDVEAIEIASRAFTGRFRQHPPPFSAKKVSGVRAYRIARRRQPVELDPVEVTVHRLEIRGLEDGRVRCRVSCSKGFYMRALAHDIGQRLGCGACLEGLRREQSGTFTLEHAIGPDQLEQPSHAIHERLIAMMELLPELPGVVASPRGSERVAHGNMLMPTDFTAKAWPSATDRDPPLSRQVKVYDPDGALLAIAEVGPGDALHPRIVLV